VRPWATAWAVILGGYTMSRQCEALPQEQERHAHHGANDGDQYEPECRALHQLNVQLTFQLNMKSFVPEPTEGIPLDNAKMI